METLNSSYTIEHRSGSLEAVGFAAGWCKFRALSLSETSLHDETDNPRRGDSFVIYRYSLTLNLLDCSNCRSSWCSWCLVAETDKKSFCTFDAGPPANRSIDVPNIMNTAIGLLQV